MAILSEVLDVLNVPQNLLGHALVVSISVAVSSLFLLWGRVKSDIKGALEPPSATTYIPIFGHVFGLFKYQVRYLEMLRQRMSTPAYTIKILWSKTYVVVSPSLSHVALRSKYLSLEPLSVRIGGAMLGLSKQAVTALGMAEDGQWIGSTGLAERRVDFAKHLAVGPQLSNVADAAGKEIASIVNEFGTDWTEKDLYLWLRDSVTYATLVALYGPYCPAALDRSLINDVWIFDENQLRLSVSLFPSLTAREGLKARTRLTNAFEKYISSNHHQYASTAVKSTIEITAKHGLSINDSARLEIFNISVATVNTTPTAIWMILNILADDSLLADLRAEVESVMTITPARKSKAGRRIHLDFSKVEETCPLLQATYLEALRLGSIPSCNRAVLEDTVLTDPDSGRELAMKKGNRVVIPTFMLHFRDSFWDNRAHQFDASRFLNSNIDPYAKKSRNTPFVPYGGGVHLCPGRHLAKAEILGVAGMLLMALEFQLKDGGKITVPSDATESGSKKPAVPILVKIRRRAGWEDVEWSVKS